MCSQHGREIRDGETTTIKRKKKPLRAYRFIWVSLWLLLVHLLKELNLVSPAIYSFRQSTHVHS